MNRKRWILLAAVFAGLIFLAAGTLSTAEEDIPDEIMIENEGYKRKLFKPVRFTHLEHYEDFGVECDECHHDFKGGENVWQEGDAVKKCVLCHNPNKKQGSVHRLVFAYHLNCKKCHKENESGPIHCEECHTKK